MTLRYRNTPDDITRSYTIIAVDSGSRGKGDYYFELVKRFGVLLWSVFVAFALLKSRFLGCVFVTILVTDLARLRSFSSSLWNQYSVATRSLPTTDIELDIGDDGFTETQAGIVSHVPWSSVLHASIREDLLLLKLASGQHAVIPRRTLQPETMTLEAVSGQIRSHLPTAA